MSYSPHNYAARFKRGEYICPYCGSEANLSVTEKFPGQKEWACGICGKTWAETIDMVKAAFDPTVRIENLARQALDEVLEEQEISDPVNHPKHYAHGRIECIEAIKEALGNDLFAGYLRGNILKYIWRCDKKGNLQEDLEKANWYLNHLIDLYERSIDEREQNL